MYQHPKQVQDKARQSLLITGSARSGTSIFGKLVGSLDTAEYFFEPPLLFSLFSILDDLPENHARFLFETYVYDELLAGALSGRSMNMRQQDESSIYHRKSIEEIRSRLEARARKSDLDTLSSTCICKVPDFVYKLASIVRTLKLSNIIISIRDPYSTISSLVRKEWFADHSLKAGNIMWPNRFSKGIPIPHWVPECYIDEWECMNEVDRAALYYIAQTTIPEMTEYCLVFDYDQMNSNPSNLIENVASRYGLAFGTNTETIIRQVKVQNTYSRVDLRKVRQDFRELVVSVYEASSKLCMRL